ncbi:MAG: DNA adenine methylase [Nitrosomonadales bacterium]|nr:DNA adenine methylase [Nitrosomonadales bacterium]
MRYPGGKGGAGIYQKIINLIPPHTTYIEPFVGGGSVYRAKRPALASVIIDADAAALEKLKPHVNLSTTIIHGDAITELAQYHFTGTEFIYCDPPYIMSTRSGRRLYNHEMTDDQHRHLVSVLLTIPASVMLSGYRNDIYDKALAKWKRIDFEAMTRGGLKTESLWLNYEPPAVPSELTFLGENYRERERIKRKKARWADKLCKLPPAERAAILERLLDLAPI